MNGPVSKKIVAALDLGTQTFRMVLACLEGDRITVLESLRRGTRLGRLLSDGPREGGNRKRLLDTLEDFGRILEGREIAKFRACGTAAFRRLPRNRNTLFHEMEEALGRSIDIIDGREEARLTLKGVEATLPGIPRPFLLVDIGGGSTELLLRQRDGIAFNRSVGTGAASLTEKFIRSDPPSAEEILRMKCVIEKILHETVQGISPVPCAMVFAGGTATTAAAMLQGLGVYDPARIRGYAIDRGRLKTLFRTLVALNDSGRRKLPGLEPSRSDIILAGLAVMERVCALFPAGKIYVSDGGLLLGILIDLAKKELQENAQPPHTGSLYV